MRSENIAIVRSPFRCLYSRENAQILRFLTLKDVLLIDLTISPVFFVVSLQTGLRIYLLPNEEAKSLI